MADIPRWLELQAEIDYRIFLSTRCAARTGSWPHSIGS